MRHKLTTLFVAIIIFIATTFPVAAHIQHAISCVASNNSVHTPKHICSFDTIPNYVIPYNVPLVDKAPVTAVDAKLSQLLVPVKHYCLHTHDLAAVDRALKPYMLYAKEHNRIEHFYTGVSYVQHSLSILLPIMRRLSTIKPRCSIMPRSTIICTA